MPPSKLAPQPPTMSSKISFYTTRSHVRRFHFCRTKTDHPAPVPHPPLDASYKPHPTVTILKQNAHTSAANPRPYRRYPPYLHIYPTTGISDQQPRAHASRRDTPQTLRPEQRVQARPQSPRYEAVSPLAHEPKAHANKATSSRHDIRAPPVELTSTTESANSR